MANISNNTSYNDTSSSGPAYRPSLRYSNLAEMKRQGGSPFAPQELQPTGTPQYYQGIKESLANQYGQQAKVKTAEQFFPPADPTVPIPVPSDYSGFVPTGGFKNEKEGTALSWQTPINPVIQNLPGEVPGQYVQDAANPEAMVKSLRGYNPQQNKAILQGRPSFLYQIDHIVPLALGGADTMGNRQVLTMDQNNKKTIAQAVPYTLYAHGQLSLKEARDMAMQWQNRDITDLPQPDQHGLLPLDKAKLAVEIWKKPKEPTLKEKIGEIPQMAKDFGKGWLPDGVREFVKGFGSGASFGFIPYEQGEDQGTGEKIAGIAGQVAGGVASFAATMGVLNGALAAGGLARGAFTAWRGTAAARAAASGFGAAEAAAEVAAAGKAATTFKTLNQVPTYLQQLLTRKNILKAGKLGVANAMVGQAQDVVSHHLNPDVLSGKKEGTVQEYQIAKIFSDLAVGSVSGIAPPTLKGAAMASMLPTTISYITDPDDPVGALTNGVIFGAMHMVEAPGRKKQMKSVMDSFEETANQAAYRSLGYYAPDLLPALSEGSAVPPSAKTFELAQQAKGKAVQNIWKRYFFDQNPDGTPSTNGMTLKDALNEVKRVTASARQLYKGGLAGEMRTKADVDDLLSYGKMAKSPTGGAGRSNLQNRFDSMDQFSNPVVAKNFADTLDDATFNRSFADANATPPSGKYITGDIALTGAGLDVNTPAAQFYFEQKAAGNASPKILLVDRSDTAPMWRMKNDLLSEQPDLVKSGRYAPDPNPENSLQAFGIVRDPKTNQKSLIPLGWVASDHRLNKSTHPQALAFNQHPLVLSGEMPAIKIEKDALAPKMRQEGVEVLIANLDPRATPITKQGQRPFIPVSINDMNWAESKRLSTLQKPAEFDTPLQKDIADVNSAVTAKGLTEKIAKVKQKVKTKASALVPKTIAPEARGSLEQEATRSLLDDLSTNGGSVQENVEKLVVAAREGKATPAQVLKLKLAKPYLESDAFKASPIAKSFPHLSVSGGMESYPVDLVPDAPQTYTNASKLTPEAPQVASNGIKVTPKVPEVTPAATQNGLADRIISSAKAEVPPSSGKPAFKGVSQALPRPEITPGASTQAAKAYIDEGKIVIDEAIPQGTGAYQLKNYEDLFDKSINRVMNRVQADLQKRDMPQSMIDDVKAQVEMELGNAKAMRLDALKLPSDVEMPKGNRPKEDPAFVANKKPIDAPVVYSSEFYNYIDKGLAADKSTPQHFGALTWDSVLTHLFGQKYRNNVEAARWLSTKSAEGSRFWNFDFFNETNASGKPIKQNKDILNARAAGDRNAEYAAINSRKSLLKEVPSGEANTLSEAEKRALGMDPEQMQTGMRVTPWYQEENMIQDLTQGEDLMAGISSELPISPAAAVGDVKRIFLGTGRENPGLLKYINDYRVSKGQKKASIPASLFAKLEEIAKKTDTEKATTAASQSEAKNALSELEKRYANLSRAVETAPDPTLEQAMEDTKALIDKYKGLVGGATKDGAGGPGFFSRAAGALSKVFKGNPVTYERPQVLSATNIPQTPVPAAQPPVQPIAPVKSQVPAQWHAGIKNAYSLYPEVPRGFTEAVLNQESSMGRDARNKAYNFGEYGYATGIIKDKSGVFPHMLANADKTPYKVFAKNPDGTEVVPGAREIKTPEAAMAITNSILAQHIRNHYGGKMNGTAEQAFELYDKYYKSLAGAKMTPAQRKKFIDAFNEYKNATY